MQLEKLNSQSGLVLILSVMWIFTLTAIMVFGIWVLKIGINPSNQIVTTLLGVLIGTAFGSVNGALFTSMTGEVPSQSNNSTVITSKTSEIASIPTLPHPTQNNAPEASLTQASPIPVSGINLQAPPKPNVWP